MGVKISKTGVKTTSPLRRYEGFKKICKLCGHVMVDREQGYGDWVHSNTGKCKYDGQGVDSNSNWAAAFRRKRDRRAHNRAAKARR